MKKIVVMLISVILLTGCGANKITYEDFQKKLGEDWEYLDLPLDDQFKDNIEQMAYANNLDFLIFYYDLKTEKDATELYNYNKEEIDDEGSACVIKEKKKLSYVKFTALCNGTYSVVIRNKDRMITVSADEEYKKDIDEAIKKLGY